MALERNQAAFEMLLGMYDRAVSSVAPETCLAEHLPPIHCEGRTLVLGAGKAAASMAAVVSDHYNGDVEGLVVTRYGHGVARSVPGIEVLEAAHPVPDDMSAKAAREMLRLAHSLNAGDRLIFLASGGGSAVLSLPLAGLSFEEKRKLIKHLVLSGASIDEINCVRKHVSAVKGGRLAEAADPAKVFTYVISDVPNDDPADVASGPTLLDRSTLADARSVIDRYGAPNMALVEDVLNNPLHETPKELSPTGGVKVIARAEDCLHVAEQWAVSKGYHVVNLGGHLEGDAKALGQAHAQMALDMKQRGQKVILLSGGEATVEVRNPKGCGGPNMEYVLGVALTLNGAAGISALACDTDGIDGSEDAAGGFVDEATLPRAQSIGLDIHDYLAQNRSYDALNSLGDIIKTGPTRTNVNDFRAILIE